MLNDDMEKQLELIKQQFGAISEKAIRAMTEIKESGERCGYVTAISDLLDVFLQKRAQDPNAVLTLQDIVDFVEHSRCSVALADYMRAKMQNIKKPS